MPKVRLYDTFLGSLRHTLRVRSSNSIRVKELGRAPYVEVRITFLLQYKRCELFPESIFCVLLSAFSHHQHNIRSSPADFSPAHFLDHHHPLTMSPPGDHRLGNGPEAFVLAGKDIQRKSPRIGTVSTEDHAFCVFFGTTAVITSILWRLLAARLQASIVDTTLSPHLPKARHYVLHGLWFRGSR